METDLTQAEAVTDPLQFVELRGVTRRYPNGTVALNDINLKLDRGQSVAIIGRSGSGKSTLLNVLGLLDVADEGDLLIDGCRVEGHSDRQRSERRSSDLGFVFQRSHLIPALSAKENVLLGLRYSDSSEGFNQEAAIESLEAVGLKTKADAIARTLSGGEMQRVAIARTLARSAQLWLADEPTGNLDEAQSVEIIELLKDRAAERNACLVVVTHEPDIASRMDRIVTLRDGQIVGDTGAVTRVGVDDDPPVSSASAVPGRSIEPNGSPRFWLTRIRRTARFVTQGVVAHPRRAWSGIIAAATAVALTVAALGLAQSASAQVTGLFDAQRATQVTAQLTNTSPETPRWPIRVDEVEASPGVTGVEYWRTREGIPMSNGSVSADTATLIQVDRAPGSVTDSQVDWSTNDNGTLDEGETVLGSVLAERLGVGQADLNPEVSIAGRKLRVVAILTGSRSGTAGGAAFVTSPDTRSLAPSLTAQLYVETVPGAARNVADRLQDLADPYQTAQMSIDPVLSADSYRGQLEDSVSISLRVLAVVAALAGLVAVVFVNILGVGARTAEFGVRRAFGARRGELISLVVGESTLLGLLGAALGFALGFLAVMTVTAVAHWQPVFDLRLLLIPLLGALVFGTLGGLPPAIAAGRIQPADAVRS